MRAAYIFFLCVISFAAVRAQSKKYEDSLRIVMRNGATDSIRLRATVHLGFHYRRSDPDLALSLADSVLKQSLRANYLRGQGGAHQVFGATYYYSQDLLKSLHHFNEALKVFETLNDSLAVSNVYNNMGNIYNTQNNYEAAADYFKKSIEIKTLIGELKSAAAELNNLGITYLRKPDYSEARKYFIQSLELEKMNRNKQGEAESYQCLGNLAFLEKKKAEGIRYYKQAFDIYDEMKDSVFKSEALMNLSTILADNGMAAEAIVYANEALRIMQPNSIRNRYFIYETLARASEMKGDYKRALEYFQLSKAGYDSIYSVELLNQAAEAGKKYEEERREKNIALLQKKNAEISVLAERRKNWVIISVGGIVLLAAGLFALYFYLRLKRKRKESEFAMSKAELEQKLLRSQMNPHFIFNALIAIESFIYKNEPRESGRYLSGFAKLMRLILENSREEWVYLEKEVRTLEHYLNLQQLRFAGKFTWSIEIGEALDKDNVMIPPMLAQPFIENAVEHGISGRNSGGEIRIRFSRSGDELIFEVTDNGIGLEKALEAKKEKSGHQSLASEITAERLELINRRKSKKVLLSIRNLRNTAEEITGTSVSFSIPLREAD
jgi:tetratricopeptide (TPR) repeat protein